MVLFQFTHPGKGATFTGDSDFRDVPLFQFTHPGKGATRPSGSTRAPSCVSIHAPWEGCDNHLHSTSASTGSFQFTHPGKGATQQGKDINYEAKVSIHAPWEGCDQMRESRAHLIASFNSRTLGRVRLAVSYYRHSAP